LPMIEAGVLDGRIGPKVDEVYGIHLWSVLPMGIVGVRNGPIMASCESFHINLCGQGGHAATPQGTKDPIVAGSQFVNQLHTIISRNISPLDSAVISVGKFNSGTKENIIPATAEIIGTIRTFDSKISSKIKQRMSSICDGITKGLDVQTIPNFYDYFPPTTNHSPKHVQIIKDIAVEIVGNSKVIEPEPTFGAEDFSSFLEVKPGCFFFLGC